MIHYHPGKWSVAFAFSLRGSVLGKAFAWAFPVAVLTALLHVALQMDEFKDKFPLVPEGSNIMSNYSTVLGFLIVIRVNQAYSRWWEGGSLLQQIRGEWFNAYSSLVAFSNQSREVTGDVLKFHHQLARLISLLYGSAIQQVSTQENKVMEIIDIEGFQLEHINFMQHAHDRCEIVLQWTQKLIVEANNKGILTVAPPILSRVYNQLGNGIVNLNNARKIADFPIPFPLAQMITLMLLYHCIVTIIICSMQRTWFEGAALAFVIVLSFQSTNYIAVELEMPFGDGTNDLPIKDMQEDMDASLIALLDKRAQTVPGFAFKESHIQLATKLVDYEDHLVAMAAGSVELTETKKRGRRELHGLKEKTHNLLQRRRRLGKSMPLLMGLGHHHSDEDSPRRFSFRSTQHPLHIPADPTTHHAESTPYTMPSSSSSGVQSSKPLVSSMPPDSDLSSPTVRPVTHAAEPKDGAGEEVKHVEISPMQDRDNRMSDVFDGHIEWWICPCRPNQRQSERQPSSQRQGSRSPRSVSQRTTGTSGHIGQQYIASSSPYGSDQARPTSWY